MKKTRASEDQQASPDDMLPEYRFDYSKAKPNRFASRYDQSRVMVVLDQDISKVFTSSESVNKALRALISAMPAKSKSGTPRRNSTSRGESP